MKYFKYDLVYEHYELINKSKQILAELILLYSVAKKS